ncbi:hypothetical protein BZA05DRAFT_199739 [Tricharina praecox]|uniref:uncharacterized protein n=1 Tax=Tricharina praecox TaxID=43433 RepID=UPI0022201359|nr:uncharacterized protein BZA05DRAFT_199739 [Tricharina praecox]KAI5856398.1 hypothetical protein BZA05DRAFT_199739 [Tricharina praecox]
MDPPTTALFVRLQQHLTAIVTEEPPPELDAVLVRTFTSSLADTPATRPQLGLLPLTILALETTTSDAAPLAQCILRLLRDVPFTEVLQITSEAQILATLSSPAAAFQRLGLELLHKAAKTPNEAGMLASWPAVMKALLRVLLLGEETATAQFASDVLLELLKVDSIATGGAGVVWRRVFGDEGVYRVFFESTKVGEGGRAGHAQSRLLELMPRIAACDWELVCRSRFPAVEAEYFEVLEERDGREYGGLLYYVAAKMVADREDVMMHMLLLEFYTVLFGASKKRALAFLEDLGIVREVVALALRPEEYTDDSIDVDLLQPKACAFVGTLITHFPSRLSQPADKPLGGELLKLITHHLSEPYAPPHSPTLTLLRALPPAFLVGKNIVSLLPLSPPHPEFLRTLALLLPHEPLYREYAAASSDMYERLTALSETLVHGQSAVEALNIIAAIAASEGNWGVQEILNAPGVMGMLAKLPEQSLGAGRDTDGAAWRVLRRRWEVAKTVEERLEGGSPWKGRMQERVAGGVVRRVGAGERVEVATEGM